MRLIPKFVPSSIYKFFIKGNEIIRQTSQRQIEAFVEMHFEF